MVFTSLEFGVFLVAVFVLYWFVFNRRVGVQNLFIVAASYVFYGWWDWRFLLLIAFTSFCSWGSGLLIAKHRDSLPYSPQAVPSPLNAGERSIGTASHEPPKGNYEAPSGAGDGHCEIRSRGGVAGSVSTDTVIPGFITDDKSSDKSVTSPQTLPSRRLQSLRLRPQPLLKEGGNWGGRGAPYPPADCSSLKRDNQRERFPSLWGRDVSEQSSLEPPPTRRFSWAKFFCGANIVVNLAILGVFKYYDFFVTEFVNLVWGGGAESWLINVILPVGISFYTFQALSYSLDVYKGKVSATRDVVQFFAYVSFFPQLVAGPIERSTNLLHQFAESRSFDYAQATDGLRQMLWGFFKKLVIADNCARIVDVVWENYESFGGSSLAVAAVFFAFQIYGDFSGYSDIAIGCARLFGISLRKNFNFPYFSRDIAEFWRRWHISLTTWFRDYLYIPLGGSREGLAKTIRNTIVIFLVCGLWHGANWTYIAWGAFNALLFIPLLIGKANRKHLDVVAADSKFLPTPKEFFQVVVTFVLAACGWVIFRAPTIGDAVGFFKQMLFSGTLLTNPIGELTDVLMWGFPRSFPLLIVLMFLAEWIARKQEHALERMPRNMILRWALYFLIAQLIMDYKAIDTTQFIYFQF